MSKFKVGDQVRFPNDGTWAYGVVVDIVETTPFPVRVKVSDSESLGWVKDAVLSFTMDGRYLITNQPELEIVHNQEGFEDSPSSRQDKEKAWLEVVSELIVKGMSAEYAVRQADTMIAEYRKRFGLEEGYNSNALK